MYIYLIQLKVMSFHATDCHHHPPQHIYVVLR